MTINETLMTHKSDVYNRRQLPLMLFWAYTIQNVHKSQGRALNITLNNLGTTEKCSGMTLVALSRV